MTPREYADIIRIGGVSQVIVIERTDSPVIRIIGSSSNLFDQFVVEIITYLAVPLGYFNLEKCIQRPRFILIACTGDHDVQFQSYYRWILDKQEGVSLGCTLSSINKIAGHLRWTTWRISRST